jgi:hypothetical protein
LQLHVLTFKKPSSNPNLQNWQKIISVKTRAKGSLKNEKLNNISFNFKLPKPVWYFKTTSWFGMSRCQVSLRLQDDKLIWGLKMTTWYGMSKMESPFVTSRWFTNFRSLTIYFGTLILNFEFWNLTWDIILYLKSTNLFCNFGFTS